MAKEIANMVAITIVYRKQVIKVGASDLRICTVLSCIPYPHIPVGWAVSFGVICSIIPVFFGVFSVVYNSRRLLFCSTLCSVDIVAYRALSRSRLHSFEHTTSRLMGVGAYPEPICHGMTL
jgi:hypothetical protein